jgi:small GTP-binding protein
MREEVVLVGDRGVGKTTLLYTYKHRSFPESIPSILDPIHYELCVEKKKAKVTVWDTRGPDAESDSPLRRIMAYRVAKVVIICYAGNQKSSYSNIEKHWIPEVSYHCPTCETPPCRNEK